MPKQDQIDTQSDNKSDLKNGKILKVHLFCVYLFLIKWKQKHLNKTTKYLHSRVYTLITVKKKTPLKELCLWLTVAASNKTAFQL